MGWCDNTVNLSNVSLNPYMQQPYKQVAIYRNEVEVFSILKKQLSVLIVICALMMKAYMPEEFENKWQEFENKVSKRSRSRH